MDIRGFIETSFVDWDGKIVSTVFTAGCNFRCIFCYNYELAINPEKFKQVPMDHIMDFLKEHSDFIDGLCITGGEPSLQNDLPDFCKKIKSLGFSIKLDANGTHPEMLQKLIEEKLVDYVAMDIKAPLNEEKYALLSGTCVNSLLNKIKESVQLLLHSHLEYEFRTTVIPTMHSEEDIEKIAKEIKGARLYILQKFQPINVLNPELKRQKSQKDEEMERLVQIAKKHLLKVKWRGK